MRSKRQKGREGEDANGRKQKEGLNDDGRKGKEKE